MHERNDRVGEVLIRGSMVKSASEYRAFYTGKCKCQVTLIYLIIIYEIIVVFFVAKLINKFLRNFFYSKLTPTDLLLQYYEMVLRIYTLILLQAIQLNKKCLEVAKKIGCKVSIIPLKELFRFTSQLVIIYFFFL